MSRERNLLIGGWLVVAGGFVVLAGQRVAVTADTRDVTELPAASASRPAPLSGGPHLLTREIRKQVQARYLLHLPADYRPDGDRKWPLIVFLHGAGERGDDFAKIAHLGPLGYARTHADFPFAVVAPQCPLNQDWSPEVVFALIDEVRSRCAIDPDRVYLTGYSMGGAGTWKVAMDYPSLFAAVAPLCGRVIPLLSGNLWRTPVWVFHGDRDAVVPLAQSQEMVEILRGMGNTRVKFTTYAGADHEIWGQVYADPALYAWMLEHQRSDAGSAP